MSAWSAARFRRLAWHAVTSAIAVRQGLRDHPTTARVKPEVRVASASAPVAREQHEPASTSPYDTALARAVWAAKARELRAQWVRWSLRARRDGRADAAAALETAIRGLDEAVGAAAENSRVLQELRVAIIGDVSAVLDVTLSRRGA